jgi:hypothetical protein
MFSTVRSYACEAEARETAPGAPEAGPVVVVLHPGWLERIRRNRRSVIDAYLRHRCAHAELAGATVTTTCVGYDTDWVSRHAITCETGTIAFEREEMPR